MTCPGRVESINVLLDLKNVAFSSVNRQALGEVNKVLSNHYRMRVFRIYIVNAPSMLKTLAGAVTRILTERQQQKIQVVGMTSELRQVFALQQLEEDLGGARPEIKEFFPFPLQAGPFHAGAEG